MSSWLRSSRRHSSFDPSRESATLLRRYRRAGWRLRGAERTGGDWESFFRIIVKRDIQAVRRSDYVICLWNLSARRGAGTQGELTIARDADIPVFLVSRSAPKHLPGWVRGCIHRHFTGFPELKVYLSKRYLPQGGVRTPWSR